MTEAFYNKLILYLEPSEKQALFKCLQKSRWTIKGYRTLKDAPPALIALSFSQNEDRLFRILREEANKYAEKEEAIKDFEAGKVVKSLFFFLDNKSEHESDLTAIMDKSFQKSDKEQIAQQANCEVEKLQHKVTEYKEKYQNQRKQWFELKKELAALKKERDELHANLIKSEQEKQDLESVNRCLSKEADELKKKLEESQGKFKRQEKEMGLRIQELARDNEELQQSHADLIKPPILVLLKDHKELSYIGVFVRTYDYIGDLTEERAKDFMEILYVANDMPFSMKFKLQSIEKVRERIHIFNTNKELLEYIQEERS